MRNNMHIYKSTYTDVKTGVEVDPFFIVHKCKNLKEANKWIASIKEPVRDLF